MPFTQLNTDFGGKFTAAAGAAVGDDISKALQRYEEDKKKREFNDGVFDVLKDQTDSEGNSYISPEALSRWNSINPDKQAGILSAAGAKMQEDRKTKLAKLQIDAANQTSPNAYQKIYDGEGNEVGVWDDKGLPHYYPAGGSKRERLELTPEEQANAERVGKVPLRKTAGYFDYSEDPNSPINMGVTAPKPIPDPRDPTKFIGMQQPNGALKYFPRPSTMQEMVDMGYMTPPQAAQTKVQVSPAAPPAAPSAAPTGKVRVKRPDGTIGLIPAEQLSAAIAKGYQQVQ